MSAQIALSSKLPGDEEVNGLDSLHDTIVDNPDQVICALVWFDVPKVTHDVETQTDRPTVRIRRIEPFGAVEKVPAEVIKLAQDLQQERTGRQPLPFGQLEPRDKHVTVLTGGGDDPEDVSEQHEAELAAQGR